VTRDEAEELGFTEGDSAGFAGDSYDGYNDTVPPEVDESYRQGYRQGYAEGQAAYRRTVE
jgi:hypothetical protein